MTLFRKKSRLLAVLTLSLVGHYAVLAFFGREPRWPSPRLVQPVRVKLVHVEPVTARVAAKTVLLKQVVTAAAVRSMPIKSKPRPTAIAAAPAPQPAAVLQGPARLDVDYGLAVRGGTATVPAAGGPVAAADEGVVSAAYLAALRAKIDAEKQYPPVSRARLQAGRVEVGLTLTKSGEITDVHLVSACAFQRLNEAAVAAVGAAHRFRPIPEQLHRQTWAVVVPLVFRL